MLSYRTARVAGATLLALLALVSACSRPDAIEERLSQELLAAQENAPAHQLAALQDGVVTFAEYEAAVLATVSCLRDAGIEVRDVRVSPDGRQIRYTCGGAPDSGVDTLEKTFNGCRDTHSGLSRTSTPCRTHQRLPTSQAKWTRLRLACEPAGSSCPRVRCWKILSGRFQLTPAQCSCVSQKQDSSCARAADGHDIDQGRRAHGGTQANAWILVGLGGRDPRRSTLPSM